MAPPRCNLLNPYFEKCYWTDVSISSKTKLQRNNNTQSRHINQFQEMEDIWIPINTNKQKKFIRASRRFEKKLDR